jgi:hypothetical protein
MRTRTRQERQAFYRVELRVTRVNNWKTRELSFFSPSSVRPISTMSVRIALPFTHFSRRRPTTISKVSCDCLV